MKINSELNIGSILPRKYESPAAEKIAAETIGAEDNLVVSEEGEKLHKLALKSNEIIGSIDNIRKDELQAIKERVSRGYYATEEVVSNIASTLLEDNEFQQLYMPQNMVEAVAGYIDLRESDLERVDQTKAKVQSHGYQKEEVYQKVADDILDIYT